MFCTRSRASSGAHTERLAVRNLCRCRCRRRHSNCFDLQQLHVRAQCAMKDGSSTRRTNIDLLKANFSINYHQSSAHYLPLSLARCSHTTAQFVRILPVAAAVAVVFNLFKTIFVLWTRETKYNPRSACHLTHRDRSWRDSIWIIEYCVCVCLCVCLCCRDAQRENGRHIYFDPFRRNKIIMQLMQRSTQTSRS